MVFPTRVLGGLGPDHYFSAALSIPVAPERGSLVGRTHPASPHLITYYKLSLMVFLAGGEPDPTQDGLLSRGLESRPKSHTEVFSQEWSLTCLCLDAHVADSPKRPVLPPLDPENAAMPVTLPWHSQGWHHPSVSSLTWGPSGMEQGQEPLRGRVGRTTGHAQCALGFTHLPRKFKVTIIFWKV